MPQPARPRPADVFTPGRLPLREHNVYSRREDPERRLVRAVERKNVPVVFGEFGVGKTTLVQKFFEAERDNDRWVYVPASDRTTIEELFKHALERLDYRVETVRTSGSRRSGSGGLQLKIFTLGGTGEKSRESQRELVVTSPTDTEMLRIMNVEGLTIVVDEFHKANDDFRHNLADFIKGLRSADQDFPQLAIVGTTLDAEHLVEHDPGIDRHLTDVYVPLMPKDEARFIVTEGYGRLGLTISDQLVEKIVDSAAGAPTIVHSLCLDAAEIALADRRNEITVDDCKEAAHMFLQDRGRRLASAYIRAIETTGPKRYRKQVLHAVAGSEENYVTMEEIQERVSASLGESTPATALSGPLRALKEERHGRILQDVPRPASSERIHNLTTFTDPMMKTFVRAMERFDAIGFLPPHSALKKLRVNGEPEVTTPPG